MGGRVRTPPAGSCRRDRKSHVPRLHDRPTMSCGYGVSISSRTDSPAATSHSICPHWRTALTASRQTTNMAAMAFIATDDKRGALTSGDNEEQEKWPEMLTERPIAE